MRIKKLFRLGALLAIMCLSVVLLLGALFAPETACAEDLIHNASEEEISEITSEEAVESIETEDNPETAPPTIEVEQETEGVEETEHTVASRLKEWFSVYFLEFIASVDLAAVAGCIIAVFLERKSNKKNTEETKTSIMENTAETKRNTASNDEVLRVANQLIDSTNALAESEEKRDVSVGQLLLLNRAVLEILVTVYVNNKNIPQATKDLVNMKYVAAIKGGTSGAPDEVKEVSEG